MERLDQTIGDFNSVQPDLDVCQSIHRYGRITALSTVLNRLFIMYLRIPSWKPSLAAPRRRFAFVLAGMVLILSGPHDSAARPIRTQEPWIGEMGVSESTQQIMDRHSDYVRPAKLPFRAAKKHPLGRIDDDNLLADFASPDVPLIGDAGGQGIPSTQGQSSSVNFTAVTLNDTLAFPPDSMGAVGPSQVIVAVNGRIRSFNKTTGLADGVLNVNPDVFFNSVLTAPVSDNFTSDPRIRYDRISGRWFLIIIDVPGRTGTLPNRILFAVSDSAVIAPLTVWTFFQFQHDLPTPTSSKDNGKFADYPTLGIDANALYIGVNIFGTRGVGSFSSTTAFVVRKSSLVGGGPIVVTPFRGLTSNNPNASGPFTPQGVDNHDPTAAEGYFIGVASRLLGQLVLLRVNDPGGSPTLSPGIHFSVPLTGEAITVPHLGNNNGSSGQLDGLDRRLIAAHIRNGRLWTSANIGLDNTGSPNGTDTRVGVRWYELDGIAGSQAPGVVQAGTLFESSPSNGTSQRSYWMGSIMVSGQGHALLGFSAGGENEYINAGYAGRLAGDAPGTLRAPILYTASSTAYNPTSNPGGSSGRRWGDYTYTVVDPDDDMTMWTFQQWCQAQNSYAVQVLKVLAPPPATPIAANPDSIQAGQSSVDVTVFGTSVDGSGFFDPGPAFPNHVAASIAGSGVVVNSVTYNNPTNLILNLSVTGNAASGDRAITVTNPDGQDVTSASGLISILGAPNNPPTFTAISNQVVMEETLLSIPAGADDVDEDSLTFSFDFAAPAGANIHPMNGTFTWTPNESQGPSTNTIALRVTDDGAPMLSATQSFDVIVLESNRPPQITAVADKILHAGMSIIVTNVASDPDIPTNALFFSLDPGAPPDSIVEPNSGVLTWATSPEDTGTAHSFTIRVTDSGNPPLDASTAFSVSTVPAPQMESLFPTGSEIELIWSAIPGLRYQIQTSSNLNDSIWSDISGDIIAEGSMMTNSSSVAATPQYFYRILVLQ